MIFDARHSTMRAQPASNCRHEMAGAPPVGFSIGKRPLVQKGIKGRSEGQCQ